MRRAAGSARVGTVERRGPLPKVLPARRIVQWVTTAVVILIGIRFTQWVVPHLDGRWPTADRPPGVEAFLPIGGMLATRHLLEAGVVDAVHPAGLAIFLGICLMSLVVAKSFCSHLCPYGALVGLLGRLAPLKVERDVATCTGCQGCTKVCPAALPVHRLQRVASVECTSCQDCVVACPVKGCLAVRPPRVARSQRWLRPLTAAVVAVAIYCSVVAAFRVAGHWQTQVTEAEYHARLREIHSPAYLHPGGSR